MCASMVATCHWTVSREKGFPRSACKASPLGAHQIPARGTNVAPPLPVLTYGECTNAGTNKIPISTKWYYTVTTILIVLTQRH